MSESFTMNRFLAAIALLVALQAHAQGEGRVLAIAGAPGDTVLSIAAAELEGERVIKGAPYCADASHETIQTLADGNRIVQRQQSRLCRDEQGRTRQEVGSGGGRQSVYLRDPVAQEAWLLDPQSKRAIRLDAPPPPGVKAKDESGWWQRTLRWTRDLGEKLWHKTPPSTAAASAPATGASAPVAAPMMMRVTIGGLPPPPGGPLPPPLAVQARLASPRGPGVTTPLPADAVEGLKLEGKRTTWTIEAGKIGNERPIVVVRDVWSSPELGVVVRSRDLDPALGEENYALQNIRRGEPDAALFRVPGDYKQVSPTGTSGRPGAIQE
jgi:hypothetical protein